MKYNAIYSLNKLYFKIHEFKYGLLILNFNLSKNKLFQLLFPYAALYQQQIKRAKFP